jgi:thiol:disulfide interchange protein DsbC
MRDLSPSAPVRRLALGVGLAAASISLAGWAGWQMTASAAEPPKALVQGLKKHFPRTSIDEVRCDLGVKGVCEVVTGRNVFYAARDGRFVMVGSLLDLEAKTDLTDQRLRQLAAMSNAAGRIAGEAAPAPAAAPPTAPGADRIEVTLSRDSAVIHNRGARLKLSVFSDLNCGYCRQLFGELRGATDIEVAEFPLAILGADSAEKAKMALCAQDRVKAVRALYFGGDVEIPAACKEGERHLASNMAFAEANAIAGTPALIRSDGAVHRGWMSLADLRAWLGEPRS